MTQEQHEKRLAQQRRRRAENSGARAAEARKQNLKYKFGLSVEEYDRISAAQDHRCAICRGVDNNYRLAVDHDHGTGQVRGLLCRGCNTGIGGLKDSPLLLEAAASYLRRYGKS